MNPRKAMLPVLLIAALLAGCTETRSRLVSTGGSTSFFIDSTLSKPGFGGSATRSVEINVDDAKLAEQRPLSVSDFNYVKTRGENEDPTLLEGFLWYFSGDQKVLIAIGHRSRKPGDKTISPFVVGDFPAGKEER